jgi:hypothetical protein
MVMSRITFQKRQKEMKRQEKQRMKAERRAQKKLAKINGEKEGQPEIAENLDNLENLDSVGNADNESVPDKLEP